MQYWNQENFIGLETLADALRADDRCVEFANYCDLRAKGLRDQAFQKLNTFLASYANWPEDSRREWANGLMELQLAHSEVHQLITHPLELELVGIFEKWAQEELDAAAPCRWLGVLTHSMVRFEDALARDAEDQYSRWRLAGAYISDADFACHHLPVDFIGRPAEAVYALDTAEEILRPISATDRGRSALQQIKQLRQAIEDWICFQASDSDDFDAWCKQERGYTWE